jgi:hypothetical protein
LEQESPHHKQEKSLLKERQGSSKIALAVFVFLFSEINFSQKIFINESKLKFRNETHKKRR